jgi:osmotically-inducible protein OsmY
VERDIRRLGGVTDIVNLIGIRPSADQVTDPVALYHKIENTLRRSAEVEASHITVEVTGTKVTLRGKVKTWWERSLQKVPLGRPRCDPGRRSADLREMT